jgi:hypothetical protein
VPADVGRLSFVCLVELPFMRAWTATFGSSRLQRDSSVFVSPPSCTDRQTSTANCSCRHPADVIGSHWS